MVYYSGLRMDCQITVCRAGPGANTCLVQNLSSFPCAARYRYNYSNSSLSLCLVCFVGEGLDPPCGKTLRIHIGLWRIRYIALCGRVKTLPYIDNGNCVINTNLTISTSSSAGCRIPQPGGCPPDGHVHCCRGWWPVPQRSGPWRRTGRPDRRSVRNAGSRSTAPSGRD